MVIVPPTSVGLVFAPLEEKTLTQPPGGVLSPSLGVTAVVTGAAARTSTRRFTSTRLLPAGITRLMSTGSVRGGMTAQLIAPSSGMIRPFDQPAPSEAVPAISTAFTLSLVWSYLMESEK